jgi:hypothetical protein
MSKEAYLERLRSIILKMHGSDSKHQETVAVVEHWKGKIIWEGEVEVFALLNHPKAKTCYAWAYSKKGIEHATAVLELPPVISPQTAVQIAVANEIKNRKSK